MRKRRRRPKLNTATGEGGQFFPGVQKKLAIGTPGDAFEVEADKMADNVVNGGENNQVQKMDSEEEPGVQQKPLAESISTVQKKGLSAEEEPVQQGGKEEESVESAGTEVAKEEESVEGTGTEVAKEEEPVENKEAEAEKEPAVENAENLEEEPVQKMSEEQEEQPVQKQEDEEESPVQKMENEQDEPVQKMSEETEQQEEPIQKQEKEEETPVQKMEEDTIQTKTSKTSKTSSSLESKLKNSKTNGGLMDSNTRQVMENGFSADFSNVKIHTDALAVEMNKELGAQAFTHGNDIYFNEGKYDPSSAGGKHLLAHELTHTIQQGKNRLNKKHKAPHSTAIKENIQLKGIQSEVRTVSEFIRILNTSTTAMAPVERVRLLTNIARSVSSEESKQLLKKINQKGSATAKRFKMLHTGSRKRIQQTLSRRSKVFELKIKADFEVILDKSLPSASGSLTGRKVLGFDGKKTNKVRATIEFNQGSTRKTDQIKISIRGNNRQKDCAVPPFKIGFNQDPKLLFNTPSKKIKLVSHCLEFGLGSSIAQQDKANQKVIKEFLIYQIAENVLGDQAFKTQLVSIDYRNNLNKSITKGFAILVEHKKDLAKRIGSTSFSKKKASKMIKDKVLKNDAFFNSKHLRLELFQVLINNIDWGIQQNTALTKNGTAFNLSPYDFDLSHLVEPDVDNPNPNFNKLFNEVLNGGNVLKKIVQKNKKKYRKLLRIEKNHILRQKKAVLKIIKGSLLNKTEKKKFLSETKRSFKALTKV